MSEQAAGPGRRLTPGEEAAGAELFARGASDRQVAEALEVGAGTANRLRHRMADRIAELSGQTPANAMEATVDLETRLEIMQAGEVGWRTEVLETAQGQRDQMAAALSAWQTRAAANRETIKRLDVERAELLVAGGDAAPLRAQRTAAEDDLADCLLAAELIGTRIAEADARIEGQQAGLRRLAEETAMSAAQASREAADLEGERLVAGQAGLLKAVAEGKVRADEAAAVVARLHALAEAAGHAAEWWDQRLLPPNSLLPGDPWMGAVGELLAALARGYVDSCYALAPLCLPWQDRDEAFFARERAEIERRREAEQSAVEAGLAIRTRPRNLQPTVPAEVLAQFDQQARIRAIREAQARQHVTAADLPRPWLRAREHPARGRRLGPERGFTSGPAEAERCGRR